MGMGAGANESEGISAGSVRIQPQRPGKGDVWRFATDAKRRPTGSSGDYGRSPSVKGRVKDFSPRSTVSSTVWPGAV